MIENISELMELVEWCKDKGVRKLKIGEIEFEISDLGLSEKLLAAEEPSIQKDRESTSMSQKTLVDTADFSKEDEELLYFSSGPVR